MSIGEAIQKGIILLVIVFIVLFILYVGIILFSKILNALSRKETPAAAETPPAAASVPVPVKAAAPTPTASAPSMAAAPQVSAVKGMQADTTYVGSLRLKNTDEQTAAMIMAIVSDESGIALDELEFKSISLVEKGKNEEGQA